MASRIDSVQGFDAALNTLWDPENEVLAVDGDELIDRYGWEKASLWLKNLEQGVLLLVGSHSPDEWGARGINTPIVVNDFEGSTFKRESRSYGETVLEKLKRLKFLNHIPIVGFVGKPVKTDLSYTASGITFLPFQRSPRETSFQIKKSASLFASNAEDFQNDLRTQSPIDFKLNGLFEAEEVKGNHIEYFFESADAKARLFDLIEHAKTFIEISNIGLENDPFGRELVDTLKTRADQGLKVRLLIDRICTLPAPSEHGYVWLNRKIISDLKNHPNIDFVFQDWYEKKNEYYPERRPMTRHHRKMIIVDYEKEEKTVELRAFGGGRVLSSLSFEDLKAHTPSWYRLGSRFLGISEGTYKDISYTVSGPTARLIHDKFIADFQGAGGKISDVEILEMKTPSEPKPQDTALRYVTHDTYANQNCQNVLLYFLEDPASMDITFVNFFVPTPLMLQAMKTAAQNGKEIAWILSNYWYQNGKRAEAILQFLEAGGSVYIDPRPLHAKLYANQDYIAFGNHNLDWPSTRDDEDLIVIKRGAPEAQPLNEYLQGFRDESIRLNWHPGLTVEEIQQKMEEVNAQLILPPPPSKKWENHIIPALIRFGWVAARSPLQ